MSMIGSSAEVSSPRAAPALQAAAPTMQRATKSRRESSVFFIRSSQDVSVDNRRVLYNDEQSASSPRPCDLDFGDDFVSFAGKAQFDRAATRHLIDGVTDQIVEDAAKPLRIHRDLDLRRLTLHFDGDLAFLQFVAQVLQSKSNEFCKIGWC